MTARFVIGWGMLLAVAGVAPVNAATFCMLAAETYYQQLYCEITAQGGSAGLPSFADFRRNDATVQALLLKRPARQLGIEVAMPRRKETVRIDVAKALPAPPKTLVRPESTNRPKAESPAISESLAEGVLGGCQWTANAIVCGNQRYTLAGNLANGELRQGALDEANHMALPAFRGSLSNPVQVNDYLYRAYQRYVEKMLDIGLGASTMNFGKFAYLFKDLSEKGVDFVGRFETMYRFLKKDKASLGAGAPPRGTQQLALADCGGLGERIIVCGKAGRNYVYLNAP